MPTLGEWIHRACGEYGCTLLEGVVTVQGPDGISRPSVVSRETADGMFSVVVPYIPPEDRLTPHMLRSLCRRLALPLSDFGLTLTKDVLRFSGEEFC